jgi:hypothetical protein
MMTRLDKQAMNKAELNSAQKPTRHKYNTELYFSTYYFWIWDWSCGNFDVVVQAK